MPAAPLLFLSASLAMLAPVSMAQAQDAGAERAFIRIGGKPAGNGPCVQVEVAGHLAGHLDCATERLAEAVRLARRDAETSRQLSVAQAGSPDVEVGVASRAGTRLRLRENFGVSIRPPAVSPPIATNPMGRRP